MQQDQKIQSTSGWVSYLLQGVTLVSIVGGVFIIGQWKGGIESKLGENTRRMDRIASVLPDIQIRIAEEEIGKPFDQAVIVRAATSDIDSGGWLAAAWVLDKPNKRQSVYTWGQDDPEDRTHAWMLSGEIQESNYEALSLERFQVLCNLTGQNLTIPSNIDATASFLLRERSPGGGETFRIHSLTGNPEVEDLSLPWVTIEDFQNILNNVSESEVEGNARPK